jgi:hypothetical protein
MFNTTTLLLIIAVIISGCSSEKVIVAEDGNTITSIKIDHNGAVNKARSNMADICKGFLLSKKQVGVFFTQAIYIDGSKYNKSYNILPCYVSGTAIVNSKLFHWIIRSGGVGEFNGKGSRFLKICGKGCCDKIPGVC